MSTKTKLTRDEYFAHPAISRGTLLNFKTSPRTGSFLINKEFDSNSMLYGRAAHSMMAGDFDEEFAIFDDRSIMEEIGGAKPRSTKAYKTWKGNFELDNYGKELISYDDFEEILNLTENVKKSDFYEKTIGRTNGVVSNEKAFIAEIDGKEFKCLADVAIEYDDRIVICDWKTTRATLDPSNPIKILYELKKWDLHFQQYHYSRVVKAATGKEVVFVFVFMENHAGFEFMPVRIAPNSELLTEAAMMYEKALINMEAYNKGDLYGIEKEIENHILIIE